MNIKLNEYMKERNLTDQQFGDQIGVDRMQVFRYRHGRAKPKEDTMQKIHEVTTGIVTANDFYNFSPQTLT